MRSGVLAAVIALACVSLTTAEYHVGVHGHLSTDIGENRLELMSILEEESLVLAGEMGRRGHMSESGYSEEFIRWERFPELIALAMEIAENSPDLVNRMNSSDIGEVIDAIDERIAELSGMNQLYMDFLGLGPDELALMTAEDTYEFEEGPGGSSYITANTAIWGDSEAVDALRFRLASIQGLYDVISHQAEEGSFELAESNAGNLLNSLAVAGDEAVELSAEHSFTVSFTGLPTDAAVAAYRDAARNREENMLLLKELSKRIEDIRNALAQKNMQLITSVFNAAYESFRSWSSLPEWYEIPQTFLEWYHQSQEHAQEIGGPANAISSLLRMEDDLALMRQAAVEYDRQLVRQMDDMAPLLTLHERLLNAMSSLSWAGFSAGS